MPIVIPMGGFSLPQHLRSWKTLAAIVLFAVALNGATFFWAVSHWASIGISAGPSMQPNSDDGDIDLVFKFYGNFWEPKRGEAVGVTGGLGGDEKWGKRIVGMPGEAIEIDGTRVLINGVELDEPYVRNAWVDPDYDAWELFDDEYYVMGDNRDASFDSRYIGPVTRDQLVPLLPLWPLDQIRPLAITGLLGLVILFPGVPTACGVLTSRIARGRNRTRHWFWAGVIFGGLATALVLLLQPKDDRADEASEAEAARRTVTLRIVAWGYAVAGAFMGASIAEAIRPGSMVFGVVAVAGLYVALEALIRRGPVPESTRVWVVSSFLVFVIAHTLGGVTMSSDRIVTAFASVVAFGPLLCQPLFRYPPVLPPMPAVKGWTHWLGSQSVWWAIGVAMLSLPHEFQYQFIVSATLFGYVTAWYVGRERSWRVEVASALAVCGALAFGGEDVIGAAAAGWTLRALAAGWLLLSVWQCRKPPKPEPGPEVELLQAA
ncbi:signal peptidase I [Candidatus Amarobacter glycogenicus]|uniref:signal peptidase I n=1 Tax=Candidatus Amarobacter glycogenicus TaxID=3140699 RepID=UPI003134EC73|nr:signal peptidase I [Dehalococcoidia bacterium]